MQQICKIGNKNIQQMCVYFWNWLFVDFGDFERFRKNIPVGGRLAGGLAGWLGRRLAGWGAGWHLFQKLAICKICNKMSFRRKNLVFLMFVAFLSNPKNMQNMQTTVTTICLHSTNWFVWVFFVFVFCNLFENKCCWRSAGWRAGWLDRQAAGWLTGNSSKNMQHLVNPQTNLFLL